LKLSITLWNQVKSNLENLGPTPVVTWLSPDGRIELSGKTFLNAISKAANYLIDGCGFDNNSKVRIELENHWQAPVWKIASLVSGIGISDTSAHIFGFSDFPNVSHVISRDPFGMPEKELTPNCENVSLEVRSHGDYFSPSHSLDDLAVIYKNQTIGQAELIERAINSSITGRFGLVVKNSNLESLVFQALIPALTQNSVVLIDRIDISESAVESEKMTQIITI
jgi:uncharacterized protein (TIGR03089 family)